MKPGWTTVALGDVVDIVSGATPKTGVPEYWDGTIPWATPKDLSYLQTAEIQSTPRMITEAGLRSCAASVLPAGSVLFSSRAPIGHVAINSVPMATNQGFKSLIPRAGVLEAKYLYHWLRANRPYLESLGNGATFKEVSKAVVSRVELPLPPIDEQRRIAAILDAADQIARQRRQASVKIGDLIAAWFSHAFTAGAVQPPKVALSELGRITTGKTPPTSAAGMFDGPFPFITPGDLGSGRAPMRTLSRAGAAASRTVRPGSTLVCCIGATIGKVDAAQGVVAFNQQINAIEWGDAVEDTYGLFAMKALRPTIVSRGASTTLPLLPKSKFAALEIPVPPRAEQVRFAERVEVANITAESMRKQMELTSALCESLQARAFSERL